MAIIAGMLTTIAVYLLMSGQLSRWLYGLVLFSSVINIILMIVGRIRFSNVESIVNHSGDNIVNPLPQALILTAIVISFALIAYALTMLRQYYRQQTSFRETTTHEKKGDEC